MADLDDLDRMLGDAASDTRRWSADPVVPIETLERRAARRRTTRLASAGAMTLAVALIAAVVSTVGADRGTHIAAIDVAAEPPPVVRSATPEDVHSAASGGTLRIEGLPTEGLAVEDGDAVLLLSTDGTVLQRLEGFRLPEFLYHGELLLDGPDGSVYELDALAGVLAPRPPDTERQRSLSYGAVLVETRPRSGFIQRDGRAVFGADGDGGSVRVSWDRDIVTRSTYDPTTDTTTPVAFDLRTMSARELPEGCHVADRHGPAWFLVCSDTDAKVKIVRLDADGSTKELGELTSKSFVEALVSPDGRELLVYQCEGNVLQFGTTSAGNLREEEADFNAFKFAPLGWSAGNEPILLADGGCGGLFDGKGVFAYDGMMRTITGVAGKAAMWTPLLQHR